MTDLTPRQLQRLTAARFDGPQALYTEAALAVALTDANELRVALRKAEAELAEARAEMLKDQRRLSAAEWRREWWKARADRSEAERDRMTARLRAMHRRAQSSEGKLDRTMAMLRAILKATDPKKYHWVCWWVGAALRHSRSNSGISGEIAYSFLRKENKALSSALAVAEEALRECEAEIDQYVRDEYPLDHPIHERNRRNGFESNPARAALAKIAALKGGVDPTSTPQKKGGEA